MGIVYRNVVVRMWCRCWHPDGVDVLRSRLVLSQRWGKWIVGHSSSAADVGLEGGRWVEQDQEGRRTDGDEVRWLRQTLLLEDRRTLGNQQRHRKWEVSANC